MGVRVVRGGLPVHLRRTACQVCFARILPFHSMINMLALCISRKKNMLYVQHLHRFRKHQTSTGREQGSGPMVGFAVVPPSNQDSTPISGIYKILAKEASK